MTGIILIAACSLALPGPSADGVSVSAESTCGKASTARFPTPTPTLRVEPGQNSFVLPVLDGYDAADQTVVRTSGTILEAGGIDVIDLNRSIQDLDRALDFDWGWRPLDDSERQDLVEFLAAWTDCLSDPGTGSVHPFFTNLGYALLIDPYDPGVIEDSPVGFISSTGEPFAWSDWYPLTVIDARLLPDGHIAVTFVRFPSIAPSVHFNDAAIWLIHPSPGAWRIEAVIGGLTASFGVTDVMDGSPIVGPQLPQARGTPTP